eukprot:gene11350-18957_t
MAFIPMGKSLLHHATTITCHPASLCPIPISVLQSPAPRNLVRHHRLPVAQSIGSSFHVPNAVPCLTTLCSFKSLSAEIKIQNGTSIEFKSELDAFAAVCHRFSSPGQMDCQGKESISTASYLRWTTGRFTDHLSKVSASPIPRTDVATRLHPYLPDFSDVELFYQAYALKAAEVSASPIPRTDVATRLHPYLPDFNDVDLFYQAYDPVVAKAVIEVQVLDHSTRGPDLMIMPKDDSDDVSLDTLSNAGLG